MNSLAFLSGSTAEKQAYARHYANQCNQDIDIIVVHGFINSPTALIHTNVPGFKQIRFAEVQRLGNLSHLTSRFNSNGELCLNGLEMKKYHCQNDVTSEIGLLAITKSKSTTDSSAASVAVKQEYELFSLANLFSKVLSDLSNSQHSLSADLLADRFKKFCHCYMDGINRYILPLLKNEHTQKRVSEWNLTQIFQDSFHIIGPIFGYRLPKNLKRQLQLILNFYEKHKHLSDASVLKDKIDYLNYCLINEMDIVPAIQIKNFWPNDVQWFLDRLNRNHPCLYKKLIPNASMHLIAKWSKKTPDGDGDLEFRYSFSTLERLFAQERTENEKILNGTARSIYYRYLKTEPNLIPSYFVKTTVLWMCEEKSALINNITGETTEYVAEQLAYEWIKYARERLQEGKCSHYFIENLNLLEPCKREYLNEACEILAYRINLKEMVQFEFMKQRKQMVEAMNRKTEEFLRQIKVTDLVQVLTNYLQMEQLWYSNNDNNTHKDNALQSCFTILNKLGYADNTENNWIKFLKLIIKNEENIDEEQQYKSPIWNENVTPLNPSDIAENLLPIPYLLKITYEQVNREDLNDIRCHEYDAFDIASFQNVLNDLSNPSTIMHSVIATHGPLCTSSLFGNDVNRMEHVLKSFFQRTLIQNQGDGPQPNLQSENCEYNIYISRELKNQLFLRRTDRAEILGYEL
ncbi:unnamed protein product [Rotaria sp. Silwood2]|nr:unnamed protein product [Rotaria sp. Silwood2]